jgi:hypothetical protein
MQCPKFKSLTRSAPSSSSTMPGDFDSLAACLRATAAPLERHERAAVDLLIADRYWLARADFQDAAVRQHEGGTWIAWDPADEFLHGRGDRASLTAKAFLSLAVAMGGDPYWVPNVKAKPGPEIVQALADALGMKVTF